MHARMALRRFLCYYRCVGGVAEWDEEHEMLFVRNLKVPRTNYLDRSPSFGYRQIWRSG